MKRSEILFGVLRIPIDFSMAMASFLLAYHVRQKTDLIPGIQLPISTDTFPSFTTYIHISLVGSLTLLVFFALYHLYSLKMTVTLAKEVRQVFTASVIWLMTVVGYYFIIRDFPFSRLVLGLTWIFIIISVTAGRSTIRLIQRLLLHKGIGTRKICFLGENKISQHLMHVFSDDPGFKIVEDVITNPSELESFIKKHGIEELIQTKGHIEEMEQHEIVNFCHLNNIQYHFVPEVIEIHQQNIDLKTIHGIPLITLQPTSLDGWGRVIKRGVDIICSFIGLIILSPLFVLIGILIKLDSKGPILFSYLEDGSPTLRIGQFGKKFHFLKFRTMKANTDHQRYTILAHRNVRKDSPLVKIKDDPRITKMGKFLRQTGFDELPQLWNVLKGEMSLVGPRPHLPEEVGKYKKHQRFVLTIKPGITGLAQISGRSDLDFEEEIKLDSYYIKNWSVLLDLKILIKTVTVPFTRYQE